MTIIEQIKAEIERLKNEHPVGKYDESYDAGVDAGYFNCCNELLQSLSTLGEKSARQRLADWSKTPEGRESYEKVAREMRREAEEGEELEKEIGSYMSNRWKFGCVTPITPVVLPNFTTEDLKECARHFAQWGAEHSGSSETPNDLKEAVKNYIYKAADAPGDDWTTDDIRNAYIAGYKLHEANTPLPEDTILFNKGVAEGKRLMMEDAVEGEITKDNRGNNVIRAGLLNNGFEIGDKVHIIVKD